MARCSSVGSKSWTPDPNRLKTGGLRPRGHFSFDRTPGISLPIGLLVTSHVYNRSLGFSLFLFFHSSFGSRVSTERNRDAIGELVLRFLYNPKSAIFEPLPNRRSRPSASSSDHPEPTWSTTIDKKYFLIVFVAAINFLRSFTSCRNHIKQQWCCNTGFMGRKRVTGPWRPTRLLSTINTGADLQELESLICWKLRLLQPRASLDHHIPRMKH